jgi:hypothetical protein
MDSNPPDSEFLRVMIAVLRRPKGSKKTATKRRRKPLDFASTIAQWDPIVVKIVARVSLALAAGSLIFAEVVSTIEKLRLLL